MADIFKTIHDLPPVDTQSVAGRWHRDRVSRMGFMMEARILAKSFLSQPNRDVTKFMIIGRARSGTTLLTQLLNSHSQVRCDGEMLKCNVIDPVGLAVRLAQKSTAQVYGFKFLSYQMVQIHRMRDPRRFLGRLQDKGFRFVHLQRETLAQTLSLTVAQASRRYHSDRHGVAQPAKGAKIRLDPADFVRRIAWNEALLTYEDASLKDMLHFPVQYESDLGEPEAQGIVAARLFDWLGIAPEQATSNLRKMLPIAPENIVENWSDVAAALDAAGYGYLLPSPTTGMN